MRPTASLAASTLALALGACSSGVTTGDASHGPADAHADAPTEAALVDAAGSDAGTPGDDAAAVTPADVVITLGTDGGAGGDASPPPGSTPSPPAGAADPCAATTPTTRGEQLRTISSAGGTRWFYVHIPSSYAPGTRTELVLNFHGFTSDPFQEALLSQMNTAADRRGFIVAYPSGIAASWNSGLCCGDSAWVSHVDDVRFVRDALAAIEREWCVDPHRVFATGMSNGGFLSHRLACEASDVIAAVAPVAGVVGTPTCTPPRAVPVIHFHGTADPLVPYNGGSPLGFPSVPVTYAGWLLRDACGAAQTTTFMQGDAQCVAHPGCASGAEAILCTVQNGGHTWPGGTPVPVLGATSTDLDATNTMLDFFDRHPLP